MCPATDKLSLRPAALSDQQMLFHWRNHYSVRVYSHQTHLISWDTHCRWFSHALKSKKRVLLIALLKEEPIGVFRYDIKADTAVVSIYLNFQKTNKGYGTQILSQGLIWLQQKAPYCQQVMASIHAGNQSSIRLFEKTGFLAKKSFKQQEFLCYVYEFQK